MVGFRELFVRHLFGVAMEISLALSDVARARGVVGAAGPCGGPERPLLRGSLTSPRPFALPLQEDHAAPSS